MIYIFLNNKNCIYNQNQGTIVLQKSKTALCEDFHGERTVYIIPFYSCIQHLFTVTQEIPNYYTMIPYGCLKSLNFLKIYKL